MREETFTLRVLVDPQSDLEMEEVGGAVDRVLLEYLDGRDGVAYGSLSPEHEHETLQPHFTSEGRAHEQV